MWFTPKTIERSRLFAVRLFCFVLIVIRGSRANGVEKINQDNLNPLNGQQNIIMSQSQPTVTNYISPLSITPIFNRLFQYNTKKNPQEQKNEPITNSENTNYAQQLENTRISIETDENEIHTDAENANHGTNNEKDNSLNHTTLCSSDNDQETDILHSIGINPEMKQDETSKNPNENIEMDHVEIIENNNEEDINKAFNSIHVPRVITVSDSNQEIHQMQEQINIQTTIIKNFKQLKKNNENNKIKHGTYNWYDFCYCHNVVLCRLYKFVYVIFIFIIY